MDRLTAEDMVMLWPDELWPQEIGCLAILDGASLIDPEGCFRLGDARAFIAGRLQLVPRFRQLLYRPRRGLGQPVWVDAASFDLRDHVRVCQVPAPGDETQLLLTAEQLRASRLNQSRPLWEMWSSPGFRTIGSAC
jgi:diacylglycerol O-acyltransferase